MEPKKLEFQLNDEGHDSHELAKSDEEVEQQTLVFRKYGQARKKIERYSPPNLLSTFSLSSIEDDPRLVKEAINLIEGELQKKAMEEEMESLKKNET